jgi:hypothetical protein
MLKSSKEFRSYYRALPCPKFNQIKQTPFPLEPRLHAASLIFPDDSVTLGLIALPEFLYKLANNNVNGLTLN